MSDPDAPFQREESLDKPGIVGARWWQRSLEAPPDMMSRRHAVQGMLIAGGVVAGLGVMLAVAGAASHASSASSASSDYRTETRPSLEAQKSFGWSFGAPGEALTFDGQSKQPFDRDALGRMVDDLRPARREHAPWYVPTLFQAIGAQPRERALEETTPTVPLAQVLQPISTAAMDLAYRRGKALASLFQGKDAAVMVVVDLPGPEAVAFAAGAAAVFDPVFAVDNWPHPRGVVPAHQTLAAAAYYQPLFAKRSVVSMGPRSAPNPGPAARAPAGAPALVVLDRRRLASYSDDATQFDNRHVARVPGAAALKGLGIKRVLYVAPGGTDRELDDLNDDLVAYLLAGMEVRLVGADAFGPDPRDAGDTDAPFYYGSSAHTHLGFWLAYRWIELPHAAHPEAPVPPMAGAAYAIAPRASPFSSGSLTGSAERPRPPGFATVPVIVSVATGLVLGAKLFRSGSWNRASGYSGG